MRKEASCWRRASDEVTGAAVYDVRVVRRTFCDADQFNRSHQHGRVSFTRRVGRQRHQISGHLSAVRQRSWRLVSDRQVQTVPASQTAILHHQHRRAVHTPLHTRTLRVLCPIVLSSCPCLWLFLFLSSLTLLLLCCSLYLPLLLFIVQSARCFLSSIVLLLILYVSSSSSSLLFFVVFHSFYSCFLFSICNAAAFLSLFVVPHEGLCRRHFLSSSASSCTLRILSAAGFWRKGVTRHYRSLVILRLFAAHFRERSQDFRLHSAHRYDSAGISQSV